MPISEGREVYVKKLAITAVVAASQLAIATLPTAGQSVPSNRYAQLQRQGARALAELNMDAVPTLNPDNIREVQRALLNRGFEPGPIDGILGPQTEAAVRDFQDRYGIKASGKIDNQTLFALGEAGLSGQP
jgi:hypothetical protein